MSADTNPTLTGRRGGPLRTTRRRLLAGAGAVAAAAAVAPLAAACQQQAPTTKKSGPAKIVLMTDPNEFKEDDQKLLQDLTKVQIELVGIRWARLKTET